jgi:DNA-directed RNA polymerase specialized sigma24 family protein
MNPRMDILDALRPRLMGIAYRMLGTRADAEDVLHDARLRWHTADASIAEISGWNRFSIAFQRPAGDYQPGSLHR